jgi:protein gp37
MNTSTLENLKLSQIIADDALQGRERLDWDRVELYAQDMRAGVKFPPIRVFRVTDRDNRLFVCSGFHRYHAAQEAELETIAAEVIDGTYTEARQDAAVSNNEWDKVTTGSRRTNADKKRTVRMLWEELPKASHRKIAKLAGVNDKWVGTLIKEWTDDGADRLHHSIHTSGDIGNVQVVPDADGDGAIGGRGVHDPSRVEPAVIVEEPKSSGTHTFTHTNENVGWAKWTWSPVTGCKHGCPFCYCPDIVARYPMNYPNGFDPTERLERLDAPRNTKVPRAAEEEWRTITDPLRREVERMCWRNVFVCSMGDLFGKWVPKEWIDAVFGACRESPQWNYLFLTKSPGNYVGLDFPPTSWVGTSVVEQKWVANAEKSFRKIDVPIKWLSVEPMLEQIEFTDLKMFDWVVIGGQSQTTQVPELFPDPHWVARLIDRAHSAGCKVFCKTNADPEHYWSGLFQEYPDAFFANSHPGDSEAT